MSFEFKRYYFCTTVVSVKSNIFWCRPTDRNMGIPNLVLIEDFHLETHINITCLQCANEYYVELQLNDNISPRIMIVKLNIYNFHLISL